MKARAAAMRYDPIREHVQAHFRERLLRFREEVNSAGPVDGTKRELLDASLSLAELPHDEYAEITYSGDTSDLVQRFCVARGLSTDLPDETRQTLAAEIHKGHRDFLRAAIAFDARLAGYDLATEVTPIEAKSPVAETAAQDAETLAAVVRKYLEENRQFRGWEPKTVAEKTDALNLLTEILGADHAASALTKADARAVKDVLLRLPKNRRKNPRTRDLSLHEALEGQACPRSGPFE